MDPVNGLNQIIGILRQKLASPSTQKAGSSKTDKFAPPPSAKDEKLSTEELKRKLAERIKVIYSQQNNDKKMAQLFIETIMTWEFGEQIYQDPRFEELSKDILSTMESNPAVWNKLQSLIRSMR